MLWCRLWHSFCVAHDVRMLGGNPCHRACQLVRKHLTNEQNERDKPSLSRPICLPECSPPLTLIATDFHITDTFFCVIVVVKILLVIFLASISKSWTSVAVFEFEAHTRLVRHITRSRTGHGATFALLVLITWRTVALFSGRTGSGLIILAEGRGECNDFGKQQAPRTTIPTLNAAS